MTNFPGMGKLARKTLNKGYRSLIVMEEQQVQQRDSLTANATKWQVFDRRGDRIPQIEINLLRDRELRQETTDKQNRWETKLDIFASTEPAKIIPKTAMEIDWLSSMEEENSLPDLIGPGTASAGVNNQPEEKVDILLTSPVLADLIDLYAYEQLETAFAANLQQLETVTGCPQPTREQIENLAADIAQMQAELVKMRQAMAKVFTTQKRTQTQYNFAQSTANNWEPRAQIAQKNGDDILAKEALFRQKANASIAASLRVSLDWQLPLVDTIKQNIIELEIKMYETKTQKELLAALLDAKAIEQVQTAVKASLQELEILTDATQSTEEQIQHLELLLEQLQWHLVAIRDCNTQAITAQKNTQKQFYLAQSLANNWQRRANIAKQNSDEAQIKEWSIRQKADADTAAYLKIILDLQTAQVEFLKYNLSALELTISQVKAEKELLKISASLQYTRKTSDRVLNPKAIPSLPEPKSDIWMIDLDDDEADDYF